MIFENRTWKITTALIALSMPGLAPENLSAETWQSVNDSKINPLKAGSQKATVLVFIASDCPVANRFAPEIQRIINDYKLKGIKFFLVYEDEDLEPQDARSHLRDYLYATQALLDPSHTLAKKVGATVTPQAVVLDPQGAKLYTGRIDNRVVEIGKYRAKPTKLDLRDSLAAILQGKPVPVAQTTAIGCFIPGQSNQDSPSNH